MNIEHPTSNIERSTKPNGNGKYDLEERLLDYSVRVMRLVEALPCTRTRNHIAGQLLRSGTASLPNHGEAQAAESRSDFIHKLKVCLKELRETRRWLLLTQRVPLVKAAKIQPLLDETEELIRIFFKSITTSQQRGLVRAKLKVERSMLNVEC